MDNTQRRTLSLKLDFMDLFVGMSSLPAMNLIPSRNMFMENRRKTDSFNAQLTNFLTNEKLENVYNAIPKTWLEGLNDTRMNLGNYSPSLTIDLAKAIEKSMQQINYMKYPNKIIDMFNSEKIISNLNNIENLIYSKINQDFNPTTNTAAKGLNHEPKAKTAEETAYVARCSGVEIEMKKVESKNSGSMEEPSIEKPRISRMWRKCTKVESARGKGRGKLQLRKSGVSQLKHKKERSKQSLHCNIQDDMDAWAEDFQDYPGMPVEATDVMPTSPNIHSQLDKSVPKYQGTDSDYPTLPQKFTQNCEPEYIKKIPKKHHDSPIQSPKDCLSFTCNFRPRQPSESSIDSEESYCIVFQDDSESDANTSDSDYESSSGEESDDEQNDIQSIQKVRFSLEPKIHVMIKWNYAYRAARRGPWEQIARDRERFRSRINCASKILNPILSLQHREQVFRNRFDAHE